MTVPNPQTLPLDVVLQQAVDHHQAGRLPEAEKLYRAILHAHPKQADANHNLGVLAGQVGKHAIGLPYLKAALEIDPSYGQYAFSYAQALLVSGQSSEASSILQTAMQRGLDTPAAHALKKKAEAAALNNAGSADMPTPDEMRQLAALFNAGHYAETENRSRSLLEQFPRSGFVWKVLGASLQVQGKDALPALQKATELLPKDAEAHSNLGNTLRELGQLDGAVTSYRRALELKPELAEAHNNLGNVLRDLGQTDEAVASYGRALAIKIDYAEAHCNLGASLKALGQLDGAVDSCRRALAVKPDYAEAHYNLGNTLKALGRLDEAVASYRMALKSKPNYVAAISNLGAALHELGQFDMAVASCLGALKFKPDFVEAHCNLGIALQALGQLDNAVASHRHALEINPDDAEACSNLGSALKDLGRLDDAISSFRRALELKPDFTTAQSNLLFAVNYHPDKSGEDIFADYRIYDQRFGLPHRGKWQAHRNNRDASRRLKVGYVSPDFRIHACRHFLLPLLAHHDKTAVDVYAYAQLAREDEITAQYRGYVDHWVPTMGMTDDALAERIRADGIDILVDLAGHTDGNRLQVFARKPAPVSVSWIGYGYTTGLSAIDYFLADEAITPAGSEGLFAEVPWRLAKPGIAYRPAEGMGAVNSLPAKARGHITFGTLTRAVRINHRTIRVWSAILNRVEGARLVIDSRDFRSAATQDALAAKFADHGISRDRLEIGYHSPPWDVLRELDIGLDCFPHNSGTTLFETLYMGVPFVTLAGRPSVGRLGSAILEAVSHPEWIASTEDDYVEIAVALAADHSTLATLRSGLRDEMQAGPMMDEVAFARKVELAYREMFAKWASG